MQVNPIKPKLKPPGTKRLKLNRDILQSTSGFEFNLRRYNVDVCYGSDLLGAMHKWQAHGIPLHTAANVSAASVLASLTVTPVGPAGVRCSLPHVS